MSSVELVLLLLMLGAVSGLAGRYIPAVPLPLLQIAVGAAISWPQDGLHVALDPEMFLLLFVPPLLFSDGWRMPKREFYALRRPIVTLAFGLVFATVLGLGFFVHWLIPTVPLTVAFALAAVLSPTDAVAVAAIGRRVGLPGPLMHILEGESLLNDASGLVALKFAVAATLTGMFSWKAAGADFVWLVGGGLGVGMICAWLFSKLRDAVTHRLFEDASIHTVVLLLLLPFAAYVAAEHLGVSGILAAVTAGVTLNFADLERSEHVAERMQAQAAWTMIESTFNATIFLLLGLQLPAIIGSGLSYGGGFAWVLAGYVVAISVALLGLRWLWIALAVRRAMMVAQRKGRPVDTPSPRIVAAAALAGIRGAITLAGALSVPLTLADGSPFPARGLLIFLATGVILFTLLAASIGLPLLLRKLPAERINPHRREEREARVLAAQAAVDSLDTVPPVAAAHRDVERAEVAARVAGDYQRRILGQAPDVSDAADPAQARRLHTLEMELRLSCLQAERQALYALRRKHRINDDTLRELVQEVDLAEVVVRKRRKAEKPDRGNRAEPADMPKNR
ncbi:MAG: Na+/H+ antiporter [Rhodoferax sp.]|nr:Na+/H+ antiporter [Rhodoferax sp.]